MSNHVVSYTENPQGNVLLPFLFTIYIRAYMLRELRSFSVCSKKLRIFYLSVAESTVSSATICCSNRLGLFCSAEIMLQRRILVKMKTIKDNPEHRLYKTVLKQQCL